jgi:hypothetical protein
MEPFNKSSSRHFIIHQYARWCAFSATRSGAPQKSKAVVYPLIDAPNYDKILNGFEEITEKDFEEWHKESVEIICHKNPKWKSGWASKLINIYLKTVVYVGQIGRPGLDSYIHPPIDGGLWDGIKKEYHLHPEIINRTHTVDRIKDIENYNTYQAIISGIKAIRNLEGWKLIEVEKLWEGTNYKS